mgnify:CR=1 FL=1
MEVFENLLPLSYVNEIEKVFTGPNFPWFYNKFTAYYPDNLNDDNIKDTAQFVHGFFINGKQNSAYYPFIFPIVNRLSDALGIDMGKKLIRIKSNLLIKDSEYPLNCYHPPHIDDVVSDVPLRTLLYYVNDSDGDTLIFNQKSHVDELKITNRQTPKKGKAIFFDSSYLHSSTPPRTHGYRIVLNFVFNM